MGRLLLKFSERFKSDNLDRIERLAEKCGVWIESVGEEMGRVAPFKVVCIIGEKEKLARFDIELIRIPSITRKAT